MGSWVKRSTPVSRIETLIKTMQWDIPQGLPVAVETLRGDMDPETMATAMQVIVRFGSKSDAEKMVPLLDDSRVTGEAGYGAGQLIQSQVRDVAIAAIAILHDVPLAEVGFPRAEKHPMLGFTTLGIGYAETQKEIRLKNIKRVVELVSENAKDGGS